MSFESLNLKFKYRSDADQIHADFYSKVIERSVQYDRAVGYFTSSSLGVIAKGLETFLHSDGYIRLIASPHLTAEDIEVIRLGYRAKYDVIASSLLREIDMCEDTIREDPLNTLAWLIFENKLDIKIAFTDNNSLYHEKFGIFYDQACNRIAFSGSANETLGGIRDNFEKIDVFWKDYDRTRIDDMVEDFERLWNNTTNGLTIIEMPDILKEKITGYKKERKPIKRHEIIPRPYQQEAIDAVKANNWNGILEMATGTGKTITSLMIANEFFKVQGRIFLTIIVPFTHLVEQWEENCRLLGFTSFTTCFGSKRSWYGKLQTDVRDFNAGFVLKHVVITTYRSAASEEFNSMVEKIRGKGFLIADECHYFGVSSLRNNKLGSIDAKLGLSATPDRWWDEAGTNYIKDFFGDTVYEYDMKTAIRNGALTEYTYKPFIIDLTEDEIERYERYTKRIITLFGQEKPDNEEISDLNRKRALILSKAENKKEKLLNIFREKKREDVSHILVYCAPGEVEMITGQLASLGYRVHRFDSKVSLQDRMQILKSFDNGAIQILVAIKCLDEGVDVPSTRTAYFVASTSNPREFVQRRGRILRTYPGKNIAEIYDFVVLPRNTSDQLFKSIASKEIPRFAEFSQYAINSYTAREVVGRELSAYSLEYLMDKLPWEVYREFQTTMGAI
ncbi:DEAD/DEAH box helicase family protein [Cytobacillus oceanisediminis]|uniref:DEAD/DEAH box helicase family protein n=1 Tax=Cytobacillus oceanisediminis TaxID=665099 RepID=UPI001FB4B553|nr:DEAD/DEAH box helicase family protein [Cytobacillus oceanisediminis]UOE53595.1 DEAD/DEAH box helicase family protein [Cytobacillus oceanisediminis]